LKNNLLFSIRILLIFNFIFNLFLIKKDVSGKISFTIDGWTSPNILSFLGITCHYIDADWKVQNILLDFVSLSGPHSGENIANAFSKCLQEMNLLTKVSNKFILFLFYFYYNKILI
jgi:hypothetical protein